MKYLGIPCKRLGEWAEVCFMEQCLAHDLNVMKPYGDSYSYDFVVGYLRRFSSVQVRSSRMFRHYVWQVKSERIGRGLTPDDADFLAAFIVPCDAWYIIPTAAMSGQRMLTFAPHHPTKAWTEQYREAWHLMK